MRKDITPPVVKDIAIAIVKEKNNLKEDIWNVYLINLKDEPIEQVLVSSKGYIKDVKGVETKTSVLRHGLGTVKAKSFAKIEPIMESLFSLHNEYWMSYFGENIMLDKKYVFLAETVKEENLITIPIIDKLGVMIK